MTHQLDAGAVGEEIAEEALEQRRDPGQSLTGQGNRHFDREQLDESRPVDGRAGARDVDGVDHLVHDQLADPEHGERNDRSRNPEQQDRQHVARLVVHTSLSSLGTCLTASSRSRQPGARLARLSAGTVRPYYRMPEGSHSWPEANPGESRTMHAFDWHTLLGNLLTSVLPTPPAIRCRSSRRSSARSSCIWCWSFALRRFGKRVLAQLNPFDLVVLLTLSNVVQNAIIGNDTSLSGGIIGAFSLLAINAVLVRFFYRGPSRELLWSTEQDVSLMSDGEVCDEARCAGSTSTPASSLAKAHERGFDSLGEVESVMLYPNGTIYIKGKPMTSETSGSRRSSAASTTCRAGWRPCASESLAFRSRRRATAALVTGATQGIGRATAFALGRAGYRVGVCARTRRG